MRCTEATYRPILFQNQLTSTSGTATRAGIHKTTAKWGGYTKMATGAAFHTNNIHSGDIHTNNRHRGGHIQTTATVQSEQTTNNTRDRVIQLRYSCINPCQWQQI